MPAEAGGASGGTDASGIQPIFIVGTTQEIFGIRIDQDVTAEMPWKLLSKQKILEDVSFRGVISDFQRFKGPIKDYPGDEIMLVYDAESKYDGNFYIVLSTDRFEQEMKRREAVMNPVVEEQVVEEAAPEPKRVRMGWISYGSDKEIVEERIVNERPPQVAYVSRMRRFFNVRKEPFDDRDALDDFTEFRPFKDPNFETKRKELEVGVQAAQSHLDRGCQTAFNRKVPASTQVRESNMVEVVEHHWLFDPMEAEADAEGTDAAGVAERKERNERRKALNSLLLGLCGQVDPVLTGNEVLDLLQDDFSLLEDEDVPSLKRGEVVLKEQQSFTHIEYSKNKRLSRVQWHPSLRGVVGVSISSSENFDQRVESYGYVHPAYLLLWSFSDPIVPKCALEAPADVSTFAFHPHSMIVVAGCVNGRVCIWDLANVQVLQSKGLVVPYAVLSSIENGHFGAIADMMWFPDLDDKAGFMSDTSKRPESPNRTSGSFYQSSGADTPVLHQFLTCGYDCNIMIWDVYVRPPGAPASDVELPVGLPHIGCGNLHLPAMIGMTQSSRKRSEEEGDLVWNPTFRVSLTPLERSGRFTSLCAFLDLTAVEVPSSPITPSVPVSKRPSALSPAEVFCKSWVGTEEGELGHVNWSLGNQTQVVASDESGQPSTSVASTKKNRKDCVERVLRTHSGPILCVSVSPFDENLLLTVGDWKWCLYYMEDLIYTSPASSSLLSAGVFSPNRPGVVFTATVDGRMEVWDLLDRTHEPMLSQVIAPGRICSMSFANPASTTQGHASRGALLAVGDETGTLRIIEIPRPFSKKILKEEESFSVFVAREHKRAKFLKVRSQIRSAEYEKQQKAASATDVTGTDAGATDKKAGEEDIIAKALDDGYKALEAEFLQIIRGTESPEVVKKS